MKLAVIDFHSEFADFTPTPDSTRAEKNARLYAMTREENTSDCMIFRYIERCVGSLARRDFINLSKMMTKIVKISDDITFLTKCRSHDIYPTHTTNLVENWNNINLDSLNAKKRVHFLSTSV